MNLFFNLSHLGVLHHLDMEKSRYVWVWFFKFLNVFYL